MKWRCPPKVFVTSHAVSAVYGLLCKIATPGQDVRASGTHGMDAVCTAVASVMEIIRRPLAALSACDRNKNFGRASSLHLHSGSFIQNMSVKTIFPPINLHCQEWRAYREKRYLYAPIIYELGHRNNISSYMPWYFKKYRKKQEKIIVAGHEREKNLYMPNSSIAWNLPTCQRTM